MQTNILWLKSLSTRKLFPQGVLIAEGDQEDSNTDFLTNITTCELLAVENVGRVQIKNAPFAPGNINADFFETTVNAMMNSEDYRYSSQDFGKCTSKPYEFEELYISGEKYQRRTTTVYTDIFVPDNWAVIVREEDMATFLKNGGKFKKCFWPIIK